MTLDASEPKSPRQNGLTMIELVVTTMVVMVIASVAIPVAATSVRRQKEIELRQALRKIRGAIDDFRRMVGDNQQLRVFEKTDSEGYPPDLEILVKGLDTGELKERKLKFLRRLPIDPMTGKADWIARSNRQERGSELWDRTHVFDVRSASRGIASDGTKYSDW